MTDGESVLAGRVSAHGFVMLEILRRITMRKLFNKVC